MAQDELTYGLGYIKIDKFINEWLAENDITNLNCKIINRETFKKWIS